MFVRRRRSANFEKVWTCHAKFRATAKSTPSPGKCSVAKENGGQVLVAFDSKNRAFVRNSESSRTAVPRSDLNLMSDKANSILEFYED